MAPGHGPDHAWDRVGMPAAIEGGARVVHVHALERGGEAVRVALAAHLAVGDDVQPCPFLVGDRQTCGVVLSLLEIARVDPPQLRRAHTRRKALAQPLPVDQPVRLRVRTDEAGGDPGVLSDSRNGTWSGRAAPWRRPAPWPVRSGTRRRRPRPCRTRRRRRRSARRCRTSPRRRRRAAAARRWSVTRTAVPSTTTSRPCAQVLLPVVSATWLLCSRLRAFCSRSPVQKCTAPSSRDADQRGHVRPAVGPHRGEPVQLGLLEHVRGLGPRSRAGLGIAEPPVDLSRRIGLHG